MQCYPFIHSDEPDCAEAADDLEFVCAHDCPAQPLQWLWPEKIPLGKVTLLIGDPGTGKSLVALDIAARASRGNGKAEGGGGKAEGDQVENVPPPSALPPSAFPPPPREKSVPLCPLPEIFTNPPADTPTSPPSATRAAECPRANDETRMTIDETANHSSFDIRHSSFTPNPQSPSVARSIAALNRLDRQRRNDRRSPRRGLAGHHRGDGRAESSEQNVPVPLSAANGNGRPPSATGHPILDALLDEFRKTPPITSSPRRVASGDPQHPTPDTS